MKYKCIDAHRADHHVRWMCDLLSVSASGFYDWLTRQHEPSPKAIKDEQLLAHIQRIFAQHRARYGVLRVWHQLRHEQIPCGRDRVARLMRQANLQGVETQTKKVCTTQADESNPVAENILNRDFTASKPNKKWVSDITYVPTKQGWLYVTTVLDLFSRKIIGWSMREDLSSQGPLDALKMAFANRRPEPGLLFHSDRGAQYTCKEMHALIKSHGAIASNSRKGNCWDNAAKESFYGRMKAELSVTVFETKDAAREEVFEYIEMYYNRIRSHSALGYLTPEQAEQVDHA